MEERLKTLRDSFLVKRKQVNSQQNLVESLEKENERLRSEFPSPTLATAKRLKLVTKQHEQAITEEQNVRLGHNMKHFTEQMTVLEKDLHLHLKAYDDLHSKIHVEEIFLFAFQQHVRDVINMLKERYLMCHEELRTLRHKMVQAIEADRPTAQTEFLKRVIKTTKIQRREKETELAEAETKLEMKSMSLQQCRH